MPCWAAAGACGEPRMELISSRVPWEPTARLHLRRKSAAFQKLGGGRLPAWGPGPGSHCQLLSLLSQTTANWLGVVAHTGGLGFLHPVGALQALHPFPGRGHTRCPYVNPFRRSLDTLCLALKCSSWAIWRASSSARLAGASELEAQVAETPVWRAWGGAG